MTKQKLKFNPQVIPDGLFTSDQVFVNWGGEVEVPYSHDVYWPDLLKLCAERREKKMARWKGLGATVGISEWDLRQDDVIEDEKPKEVVERDVVQEAADAIGPERFEDERVSPVEQTIPVVA